MGVLSRALSLAAGAFSAVHALDVLIAGDWGNQADLADMQNVASAMDAYAVAHGSSAVLSLGDNFYLGGNYTYDGVLSSHDEKFATLWSNVFKGKVLSSLPWWQILGNHDWYVKNSHLFELSYQNDKWVLPDLFYTKRVEAAPGVFATFIFIETDLLNYGYPGKKDMAWNFQQVGWSNTSRTAEKQLAWLDNALAQANNDPYVFVVGHHVGFACGSDVSGSFAMQNVTNLVNKWSASAYIHGHHHTMAYYITNGGKTLQIQAGSTGNVDSACAPLANVTGSEVANTYGFAALHVDATSAVFDFVTETGAKVLTTSIKPRTPVANVAADKTYLTSVTDPAVHFIPPPCLDLILVGDWGNDKDLSDQQSVANQMDVWANKFNSSAVVSLGDNFYLGGKYDYDGVKSTTDEKFKTLWSDVYSGSTLKNLPWWMILGNHDWYLNNSHVNELEFVNSKWSMPDFFYTKRIQVDAAGNGTWASFIFIETDLLNYGYAGKQNMSFNFALQGWSADNKTVEKQLAWLDNALAQANNDQFVIVFGHHTGFACGGDVTGSKYMANVTALVNKWNATAYVNGHHHTLASYYTNKGQTLQVQAGSGGNVDSACAPLINGTQGQELANTYGFAHLRINKWSAQFDFVTETGSIAFSSSLGPRVPAVGVAANTTYLVASTDSAVHYARAAVSSTTAVSATATATVSATTATPDASSMVTSSKAATTVVYVAPGASLSPSATSVAYVPPPASYKAAPSNLYSAGVQATVTAVLAAAAVFLF